MDWNEKELPNIFGKVPAKRCFGCMVRFKGMTGKSTMHNDMGKRVDWIKIGLKLID